MRDLGKILNGFCIVYIFFKSLRVAQGSYRDF